MPGPVSSGANHDPLDGPTVEGNRMNPHFTMRMTRATIGVLTALAAAGAVAAVGGAASAATTPAPHVSIASEISHGAHASQPALTFANSSATHACAAVIVVGRQSCFALKRNGL